MRWFKHLSASGQDEKLVQLKEEFGMAGYGAYWTIVELISAQISKENQQTFVEFSYKSWRKFTDFSPKKLQKFVGFLSKLELFTVEMREDKVLLDCPKILKYKDEYQDRKKTKDAKYPDSVGSTHVDTELVTKRKKENIDIDIKTNRAKNKKTEKKQVNYPPWLDVKTWETFRQHRKSTKPAMSADAEKLLIAKLDKLRANEDQAQIINRSIMNGWKGLFPGRDPPGKNPPQPENLSTKVYKGTPLDEISWLNNEDTESKTQTG